MTTPAERTIRCDTALRSAGIFFAAAVSGGTAVAELQLLTAPTVRDVGGNFGHLLRAGHHTVNEMMAAFTQPEILIGVAVLTAAIVLAANALALPDELTPEADRWASHVAAASVSAAGVFMAGYVYLALTAHLRDVPGTAAFGALVSLAVATGITGRSAR